MLTGIDLATGMWEPRASMPFESEAPTCALMESTGIVYCAEGDRQGTASRPTIPPPILGRHWQPIRL